LALPGQESPTSPQQRSIIPAKEKDVGKSRAKYAEDLHACVGKSTGAAAAKVLTLNDKQLFDQGNLTSLNMAFNNIGKSGAILVARVMVGSMNLQHIDVSFNGVGDEGFEVILKAAARCAQLKSINASNNGITDVGAAMVGAYFRSEYTLAPINVASPAKRGGGRMPNMGETQKLAANAIRNTLPALVSLRLAGNAITAKGLKPLADALANTKATAAVLKKLEIKVQLAEGKSMADVSFSTDDAELMTLRTLDLSHNPLGEDAAPILANLVEAYPLNELTVDCCHIGLLGFGLIAKACPQQFALERLKVIMGRDVEMKNNFFAHATEKHDVEHTLWLENLSAKENSLIERQGYTADSFWESHHCGQVIAMAAISAEIAEEERMTSLRMYLEGSGTAEHLVADMHAAEAEAAAPKRVEDHTKELNAERYVPKKMAWDMEEQWSPPAHDGDLTFVCRDGDMLVHEDVVGYTSWRIVELLESLTGDTPRQIDPSVAVTNDGGKLMIVVDTSMTALRFMLKGLYQGKYKPAAELPTIEDKIEALRLAEIFALPAQVCVIAADIVLHVSEGGIVGKVQAMNAFIIDPENKKKPELVRRLTRFEAELEHIPTDERYSKDARNGTPPHPDEQSLQDQDLAQRLAELLLQEGLFVTPAGVLLAELAVSVAGTNELLKSTPSLDTSQEQMPQTPESKRGRDRASPAKAAKGGKGGKGGKKKRQKSPSPSLSWANFKPNPEDPRNKRQFLRDIDLIQMLNTYSKSFAILDETSLATDEDLQDQHQRRQARDSLDQALWDLRLAAHMMHQPWKLPRLGDQHQENIVEAYVRDRDTFLLSDVAVKIECLYRGAMEPKRYEELDQTCNSTMALCEMTLNSHVAATVGPSLVSKAIDHDGGKFRPARRATRSSGGKIVFELEAAHDDSGSEVAVYKVDAAKFSVERAKESMIKAVNAFKLTKRKLLTRRKQKEEDFKSTPAYKIQERMKQSEAKARARGEEPLDAAKDEKEKYFKKMPASQERVLRIAKSRGIEFNSSSLIPGSTGTYTHAKPFKTGATMKEPDKSPESAHAEMEPEDRPVIVPRSMRVAESGQAPVGCRQGTGPRE